MTRVCLRAVSVSNTRIFGEADSEGEVPRYAQLDNVSKVTIDFFFGWNLKKMKEDMMLHYAGMNRVMRLALSKVTMRM